MRCHLIRLGSGGVGTHAFSVDANDQLILGPVRFQLQIFYRFNLAFFG